MMILPKIVVKKMDIELNVNMMCRYVDPEFCKRNKTRPFAERSYLLYPELRGKITEGMTKEEIYQIVKPCVEKVYCEKAEQMEEKIDHLQVEFNQIQEGLFTALFDEFEMEWPVDYPEMICYVGCISSYPRDVMTKEFFISYEKDITMLMMASIHEMNHFVFFEKWKQMHGYESDQEPLFPETLWFLEEMLVEPTLNIRSVQEVAPYPQRAYDLFYERMVDGSSMEEHIKQMFEKRSSMEQFIDQAYEFIETNKQKLL